MKRIILLICLFVMVIPFGVVYADDAPPPCIADGSCPPPPGHENDPIAPPLIPPSVSAETRPPRHENDEDAVPFIPGYIQPPFVERDDWEPKAKRFDNTEPPKLCYPFMECW